MRDAVADLVRDGDTVAIEGFTHLICFAAGHEIIRQRKRDLTLARLTPDLIYDQMIAGGVARKLIFSWLGNPGVGGLGAIRRRIEDADPAPLEVEEYSHFGMVGRYTAGATNLPFYPLRSYFETDLPSANPLIRPIESPYGDGTVYAVPPLRPDVTIVHAQRADAEGNTQVWGLLGCQKEAAFAADRVIVVVEEVVDEAVIRADPNRTIIPGLIVDAVVVESFGAHPSYVQGAYDRDNRFYLDWDPITRDEDSIQAWLRD
ncbi:MAG TPA: CoA-transferase, partial [Candidatus Binatia bacterium]|nr:CoA-transferase [Candidatus Binatia bacterium]